VCSTLTACPRSPIISALKSTWNPDLKPQATLRSPRDRTLQQSPESELLGAERQLHHLYLHLLQTEPKDSANKTKPKERCVTPRRRVFYILTPVSFMSISVPKKKRSKLRKFSSLGSPGSCTLDLTLCACRAKATHHRCPDAHNWEDHLKHGGLGCIQLTGLCIHLYIYTKKDNIYLHELKTYI